MATTIRTVFLATLAACFVCAVSSPAAAEDGRLDGTERYSGTAGAAQLETSVPRIAHASGMVEDRDGVLLANEYEIVSMTGSITRALCPYTCEKRGVARDHCKEWTSRREPDRCYVQDTSIPSEAVPLGK